MACGKGATVVCVTPAMDLPLTAPLTVSLDGHEYSDNAVDIEFTPVKLEPLGGGDNYTDVFGGGAGGEEADGEGEGGTRGRRLLEGAVNGVGGSDPVDMKDYTTSLGVRTDG